MTENEYIIATNRVKVSAALNLMRDVLPTSDGVDFGISESDLAQIRKLLAAAEINMFVEIEIDAEPDE